MQIKFIAVFAFFFVTLGISYGIVCPPDYCGSVSCPKDVRCGPGQIREKGGFCACCDQCYTILDEGDSCCYVCNILQGVPSPLQICDYRKRLICTPNNKCEKEPRAPPSD